MKLLTATARTQGERASDYSHCVEGELVWVGLVCDTDLNDPDGGCGCGRAFGGLGSHRATTTAMVRDLPGFTWADYVEAMRSSLGDRRRRDHGLLAPEEAQVPGSLEGRRMRDHGLLAPEEAQVPGSPEARSCDTAYAAGEAARLFDLVSVWPPGTVVERRLDIIAVRKIVQTGY